MSRLITKQVGRGFALRLLAFLFLPVAFAVSLHAVPSPKPAQEIPPLAPPLPEIQTTFWEQHPILKIALPSLATGFAIGLWQVWMRRQKTPPQLRAPEAQARAELAALRGRPEDSTTLSQISQTLRRYLIAAFWLHPGETTTAEFSAALAKNTQVGPELSKAAGDFLRYCDERKFSPSHEAPPIDAASRALELIEMAERQRVRPHAAMPVPKPA